MELKHIAAIGLGVFLLLGGLAMPATTTEQTRTCIDTSYGVNDCIRSSYESPNTVKFPLIVAGISLILVGGFLSKRQSEQDSGQPAPVQPADNPQPSGKTTSGETTLVESIEERKSSSDTSDGGGHEGEEQVKCPACGEPVTPTAIYCQDCGNHLSGRSQ